MGSTYEIAAEANGIASATLYDWLRKGADGIEPFFALSEAVTRARATYKRRALARIRKGALNSGLRDWKAEMTLLERMYPLEFGPQQAVNVKVEKELAETLARIKDKLDPAMFEAVLAAIADESSDEDAANENVDTGAADPGASGGEAPVGGKVRRGGPV